MIINKGTCLSKKGLSSRYYIARISVRLTPAPALLASGFSGVLLITLSSSLSIWFIYPRLFYPTLCHSFLTIHMIS